MAVRPSRMESRPLFRAIIRTVGEGGRATRRARHRGRRKARVSEGAADMGWGGMVDEGTRSGRRRWIGDGG